MAFNVMKMMDAFWNDHGSVLSDWLPVNGGVPQGTILGPLLFLIMVNDLAINYQDRWKYVDDTSLSETIGKDCQSNLQSLISEIKRWCSENDIMLNRSKCKYLFISFTKNKPNFDPLVIAEGVAYLKSHQRRFLASIFQDFHLGA